MSEEEHLIDDQELPDARSLAQYSIERKRARKNKFDSNHSRKRDRRKQQCDPLQEDVTSESSKTIEVGQQPQPELNLLDLASGKETYMQRMKQLRKSNTTIQPDGENTFTPQSPESSPKFGTTKNSEQEERLRDNRRLTLK